jgi:hypothetical protein
MKGVRVYAPRSVGTDATAQLSAGRLRPFEKLDQRLCSCERPFPFEKILSGQRVQVQELGETVDDGLV